MQYEKLCVLVPFYNPGLYCNDLINSLKSNKAFIKVLFYDDCSTDNSSEQIKAKCDIFEIEYIMYKGNVNIGYQKAINFLWNKLDSNALIAFHDADDYWSPDYAREVLKHFKDDKIDYVFTNTIRFKNISELEFNKKNLEVKKHVTVGSGIVFKKVNIDTPALFHECFTGIGGEDLFVINYLQNNFNGVRITSAFYCYRYNPLSLTLRNAAIQARIVKVILRFIPIRDVSNPSWILKIFTSNICAIFFRPVEFCLRPIRILRRTIR